MSQNPTTLSREYVTSLKTMQCLPLLSLLAEVSLLIELPAARPKKSVLALVCDPAAIAPQLGQNYGKKKTFSSKYLV